MGSGLAKMKRRVHESVATENLRDEKGTCQKIEAPSHMAASQVVLIASNTLICLDIG